MRTQRLWISLLLVGSIILGGPAVSYAESTGKSIDERLSELEREIALLKRQREVEKEIQIKRDVETPTLTASQEGFNVKSKDGGFQLKFRGQIQTDARFFAGDDTSGGSNTFLLRRVRPTLEGTV